MNKVNLNGVDIMVTIEHHIFKNDRNSRDHSTRDFVSWDGEGITFPGRIRQDYVLFGNSLKFQRSSTSLSTVECLDLMMDTVKWAPGCIHVGFAFSYDVEMILKDVPAEYMRILHQKGRVYWDRFAIEYRKGKFFQVTEKVGEEKTTCRIWDVFSFFSTSFVVALREYLGDDVAIKEMEKNKADRRAFQYDEMDNKIIPYWKSELDYMVRLMDRLREILYGADLKIYNWHGPGALASLAMTQKKVKEVKCKTPDPVNVAARYAYAGGRFELFKIGYHRDTVYSYDIRSAYPSAIRYLPNLKTGEWRHVEGPQPITQFGVYRVRFSHKAIMTARPMPFFYRDFRSAVHFPNYMEGWFWSPEAAIAKHLGKDATILEGWVYEHDGSTPFAWIEDTYNLRAEWKREGNASQLALKLLMNSMYGKFAQRVGFQGKEAPTWHQLEWAGYITSHCRARLYQAMAESHSKGGLIAVETDGIFSSVPLTSLNIGPNLGDWEAEKYDEMIYLQSGFCFKRQGDKWIPRSRGFDKGSVTVDTAIKALEDWKPWDNPLGTVLGESTRFSSMGQWLNYGDEEKWRNVWTTSPRELRLGSDGKRVHRADFCNHCNSRISPSEAMHPLTITEPIGGFSYPHKLPWLENAENEFNREKTERAIKS